MKILLVMTIFVLNLIADELINYTQAITIPSVKEFGEFTNLDTDRYLKQALKNENWAKANIYLFGVTINQKRGNLNFTTIPYHQIIANLKKASTEGSVMSMFQGYRLSSMLTHKQGKYAKKDTAFFAKQMMERDICLGYIETAYGYTRSWYNSKVDWNSAYKIMQAAKTSCEKQGVADWVFNYYKKNKSQYKTMSEYKK